MKDWIQDYYDDSLQGYNQLREAIQAVWDAVPEDFLLPQLELMSARRQMVINTNGLHMQF